MKKLNNNGTAISGILYSILVLFVVLLFGILALLASSKNTLEKVKNNTIDKLDENKNNDVTSEFCFNFDYLTGTILDYNNTVNGCSKNLVIPEEINGVAVKYIAANSFVSKGLETVDLSNAVYLKEISDGTASTGAFANNNIKTLKIGELSSLEKIGNFAFYGNSITNTVDLSNVASLKIIGNGAFYKNSISTLILKNLNKLESIGISSFNENIISGTLDLSSMSSLKKISSAAFANNFIEFVKTDNLSKLTNIDPYAFHNNLISEFDFKTLSSLKTIEIGAFSFNYLKTLDLSNTSIERIEERGFEKNELEFLTFGDKNTIKYVGRRAFGDNNFTGRLVLSNINPTWSDSVFALNNITSVYIDSTTIGEAMFAFNKIESINVGDMPNMITIGTAAFYGNETLTSVNLDEKVETIGNFAFESCNISLLNISSSVKNIGEEAFAFNIIESVDLSKNTNLSIGDLAFHSNKIKDLKMTNSLVKMGYGAFNKNLIPKENAIFYKVNPDGTVDNSVLVSYGGEAGEVILPDNIRVIGKFALQNVGISKIVFSPNIEMIDEYGLGFNSFGGVLDLSTMPKLKSIGNWAVGAYFIRRYKVNEAGGGNVEWAAGANLGYKFRYSRNVSGLIYTAMYMADYSATLQEIKFDGLTNLTTIADNAFSYLYAATTITGLEDLTSLTKIGKKAFYDNVITSDLDLSNTKLVTIDEDTFKSKTGKNAPAGILKLPSTLETISASAFNGLHLTGVEFGENIKSIGASAFDFNNISKLELPNSLNELLFAAFRNNKISSLNLPSSVEKLEGQAFAYNNLTSVDMTNWNSKINNLFPYLFTGNPITEVKFNNSINTISTNAFSNTKLTSINIPANVTVIHKDAFKTNTTWTNIEIGYDSSSLKTRFNNVWISIGWPSDLVPYDDETKYVLELDKPNYFNKDHSVYEITITKTGKYQFDVWGAQGGTFSDTYIGGLGGYSTGQINLTEGEKIYVFIGTQPKTYSLTSATDIFNPGGINGGGLARTFRSGNNYTYAMGGGGATDIRIGSKSLYARVIVAGGGSGSSNRASGHAGGGVNGIGINDYYGTQTKAGLNGFFGFGGSTTSDFYYAYGASGGGGGFYGGGTASLGSNTDTSVLTKSGGGSGYVYTSSTAKNYPSGCLLNSSYYMINALTMTGNESVPTYDKNSVMEKGNVGDGYAVITYLG